MFDRMKAFLEEGKNILVDEVKKVKNKEFLEAVMAGCAMVSAADGTISSDEKQKMVAFIKQNDALKVYDINDAIKIFTSYSSKFDFDSQIGKGECLQSISKLKKKPDQGRLMIRVCCAIGKSDGNFDKEEMKVVTEICNELGFQPSDFGL